jgi:hypothetical protein
MRRYVRRPHRLTAGHEVPVCAVCRTGDRTTADREFREVAPEPYVAATPQATVIAARLHRVLGLRATILQDLRLAPAPLRPPTHPHGEHTAKPLPCPSTAR